jgi:hypothetical protein
MLLKQAIESGATELLLDSLEVGGGSDGRPGELYTPLELRSLATRALANLVIGDVPSDEKSAPPYCLRLLGAGLLERIDRLYADAAPAPMPATPGDEKRGKKTLQTRPPPPPNGKILAHIAVLLSAIVEHHNGSSPLAFPLEFVRFPRRRRRRHHHIHLCRLT